MPSIALDTRDIRAAGRHALVLAAMRSMADERGQWYGASYALQDALGGPDALGIEQIRWSIRQLADRGLIRETRRVGRIVVWQITDREEVRHA